MKYCPKCGTPLADGAAFCSGCGLAVNAAPVPAPAVPKPKDSNKTSEMANLAKIFMVIGTIVMGVYIIPLIWCIPMTIYYFDRVNKRQPVSDFFKICSLLFVSMLGGIFMLCDKEN